MLFIFGCAGSSLLQRLFSSCGKWGLLSSFSAQASLWCFSCCWAQAPGCTSFSSCDMWAQQLQLPGSRVQSWVVVHGLSCSVAGGIFSGQGWNLCLLLWQVNSLPLSHQERPTEYFLWYLLFLTALLGRQCCLHFKDEKTEAQQR